MTAGEDKAMQEALKELYKYNAEEQIREQCEARERYYFRKQYMENKIDTLTEKLKVKDELIAANTAELAAKNEEIAANAKELAAKDEEIAANAKMLAAKDEALAAKDEEIALLREALAKTSSV